MSEIKRKTLDGVGRVYFFEQNRETGPYYPSVSTVKNAGPKPEPLINWEEKYDGREGRQWFRHLKRYAQNRGTLVHFSILAELSPHETKDEQWSADEAESEQQLKECGEYERYESELPFAKKSFEYISHARGITPNNVLDVECFVVNTSVDYAGQFDLLYLDEDNNVVLSDIKTSSGIREGHQMQLAAYENAVNIDIDTLEIIRISPDTEVWEVSHHYDWERTPEDLYAEFTQKREQYQGDIERIVAEGIEY